MIADPEILLERARRRAGLSDFGPAGWREGLEQLVAAAAVDIGDDAEAVERIEVIVVERLVNRLRIEAWLAEHEDETSRPIEGLLIVLGTGRSGTTAMHYLLAVDPRFRYPRKWELVDPVPPPDIDTEHRDPRRQRAPSQGNVQHIATVDGPAEDRRIHELSFHDDAVPLGLPTYARWWRAADHSAAFSYHERILRFLHSRRPPYRWLLKSPDYMHNLPPLAAHYPNARFVVTHRDPVAVIPSACSVIVESTRERHPDWTYDPEEFGREIMEHILEGVRRAAAARAAVGEDRFIDIGQPELQGDPIGVAERVYDFAGVDLTDNVRKAMARWASENRTGSRGHHRYTPEQFGLSAGEIREAFGDYLNCFGSYCASKD